MCGCTRDTRYIEMIYRRIYISWSLFPLLCVFRRVIFVDSSPPVIELTRSGFTWAIAKVLFQNVPTSISREYREISRGLCGFGTSSVTYWLSDERYGDLYFVFDQSEWNFAPNVSCRISITHSTRVEKEKE